MTKRVQTYRTHEVSVGFDPNVCIHSGVCLRTLPAVFDVRRRRWIQLEHASPDAVRNAVGRCPSGALSLLPSTQPSHPMLPEQDQSPPTGARIELLTDGPLRVEGPVSITTESGEVIEKPGRVHLCRCGASARKPFCDGSHKKIGFSTEPVGGVD